MSFKKSVTKAYFMPEAQTSQALGQWKTKGGFHCQKNVGQYQARVFWGIGAPAGQICALMCTQAAFRHTLVKSRA